MFHLVRPPFGWMNPSEYWLINHQPVRTGSRPSVGPIIAPHTHPEWFSDLFHQFFQEIRDFPDWWVGGWGAFACFKYTPSDYHGSSQKPSANGTMPFKGVRPASMLARGRIPRPRARDLRRRTGRRRPWQCSRRPWPLPGPSVAAGNFGL